MKKREFVDIRNAHLKDQIKVLKKIIASGDDPFSEKNLLKYHKKKIIKRGKYWLLTSNQWPYKNRKVHILAIYKKYAEDLNGLDSAALSELIKLFRWAVKEYNIAGGIVAMRFGDTRYSGATVKHIHVQLIQPDLDKPGYEPVTIFVGHPKKTKNGKREK